MVTEVTEQKKIAKKSKIKMEDGPSRNKLMQLNKQINSSEESLEERQSTKGEHGVGVRDLLYPTGPHIVEIEAAM